MKRKVAQKPVDSIRRRKAKRAPVLSVKKISKRRASSKTAFFGLKIKNKSWKKFFSAMRNFRKKFRKLAKKPVIFSFAQKSAIKITALVLIIGLNWAGISAIGSTWSYFNDAEMSEENSMAAGTLDFKLDYGEWEPAETAVNLLPGDSTIRSVNISKEEEKGLDFLYNVSTKITGGNIAFCNALQLAANLDGEDVYFGSLTGFNYGPIEFTAPENWLFAATLPSGGPGFEGLNCEFKFTFSGWQDNLPLIEGFSDQEELENLLEASPLSDSNLSPVADAYVNQAAPDANYGNGGNLYIKSKNSRNRRTYIKFDFNFPPETNILSSELKLFMKSVPPESRTYEARRANNPWIESEIAWNSQPSAADSPTDSVDSGASPDWLSWDVTSDIQGFAGDLYQNYGWQLKDSVENSIADRQAKFYSRENANSDLRPILEVNFEAPPVATPYPVINEVYYHVGSGKGSDPKNEWVEIYNPTDAPVNISGWKICDAGACDIIPASNPIPAKGFAVIAKNDSTWPNWPSIPSGAVEIILNSNIGGGLANGGDAVRLLDGSDAEIDSMSYGNDISELDPPAPLSKRGKSLARIVKGYDTNSAVDWIINATPNPGTNPSEGGAEVMRFTFEGVEVAGSEQELEPLMADEELAEEKVVIEKLESEDILNEAAAAEEETVISEESALEKINNEEAPTEETVIEEQAAAETLPAEENAESEIIPEQEREAAETTEEIKETTAPEAAVVKEEKEETEAAEENPAQEVSVAEDQPATIEEPIIVEQSAAELLPAGGPEPEPDLSNNDSNNK